MVDARTRARAQGIYVLVTQRARRRGHAGTGMCEGYLRAGRAASPLRGSAPPATSPAVCRASSS